MADATGVTVGSTPGAESPTTPLPTDSGAGPGRASPLNTVTFTSPTAGGGHEAGGGAGCQDAGAGAGAVAGLDASAGKQPALTPVTFRGNGAGPRVGLVYDTVMLAHADSASVCEERPARITAIFDELVAGDLAQRWV